jgi:hypothetical protein
LGQASVNSHFALMLESWISMESAETRVLLSCGTARSKFQLESLQDG